jgi:citrate synthase
MPRGETSNVADGLENVVAAETVLSKVDGEAGVLILRGHYLQDIAGRRSFEWLTGVLWQDLVDRALFEEAIILDLREGVRGRSKPATLTPRRTRTPPKYPCRCSLSASPPTPR